MALARWAALSVIVLYFITAFHHVYGGIVYREPRRLTEPIAFAGVLLITLLVLRWYTQTRSVTSLALFIALAIGRSAAAMFDGGFHLIKVVVYYALPDGAMAIKTLPTFLPDSTVVVPDDPWFQGSGILAFGFAFVPVYFAIRLWQERANGSAKGTT
jgi:hypothetical protein